MEQYGQELAKLTVAKDVYAVAATLYKMVTGANPPEVAVIVQDGIKPPKEINPALSEQLNSIVLQSLSVKQIHRALSISKLKADLKGIYKLAVVPDAEGDTEVRSEILGHNLRVQN
jgi:serine/threonine protein kinase